MGEQALFPPTSNQYFVFHIIAKEFTRVKKNELPVLPKLISRRFPVYVEIIPDQVIFPLF